MTNETGETEVQFISAQDDAAIRLECMRLCLLCSKDFVTCSANAKMLYNWIMDYEEATSDEVELGAATGEASCTRKH